MTPRTNAFPRTDPTGDAEILVVGAGPVGLTLACELRRRGVACRVIDRAPQRAGSSRATDIHARSLELFARMGVLEPMLEAGKPVRGFRAYSAGRLISSLEYEGLESAYPFTLALPQADTEAILERRLVELGGRIERGVELVALAPGAAGARVRLRHATGRIERADAQWVAACDGVRSTARRLLDVPFDGVTYEQSYLVGDFDVEWSHPTDVVHLFMSREGFCNVLALPGASRVRVLCDVSSADAGGSLDAATFESMIERRAGVTARLSRPESLASFRIQRRAVPEYRRGPVFFAGDAAHVCSPLMGQGMNTGVQDAFDLAWKLALVARGRSRPSLLDSYDADRRPVARAVLRDTHLLHTAATTRSGLTSRLRDLALSASTRSSFARRLAGVRCSELNTCYRGPVARALASLTGRVAAGSRLPDVPTGGAEPWRLYDLLDATRFTLIVLDGARAGRDDRAELDRLSRIASTRFSDAVAVERLRVGDAPVDRIARLGWRLPWTDVGGAIHRRLGAARPTALLVRPDGHVAARLRAPGGRLEDALSVITAAIAARDPQIINRAEPVITAAPALAFIGS